MTKILVHIFVDEKQFLFYLMTLFIVSDYIRPHWTVYRRQNKSSGRHDGNRKAEKDMEMRSTLLQLCIAFHIFILWFQSVSFGKGKARSVRVPVSRGV